MCVCVCVYVRASFALDQSSDDGCIREAEDSNTEEVNKDYTVSYENTARV
jgi:hypothetical protein